MSSTGYVPLLQSCGGLFMGFKRTSKSTSKSVVMVGRIIPAYQWVNKSIRVPYGAPIDHAGPAGRALLIEPQPLRAASESRSCCRIEVIRLLGDERLRRQNQRSYRRGILQRRIADLDRVDDAGTDQVDLLA